MAKKQQGKIREYRFRIEAYSPETMPLGRLAEYLADLSLLFGEPNSVHLIKIEKGSTVAAVRVDAEAEPKVRENLDAVVRRDAPPERMRAAESLDERLRKDNGKGEIIGPTGDNVIAFPGRELVLPPTYGPFNQPGFIIGTPIMVGGKNDMVPVHIEDQQGVPYVCQARRGVAREIAPYLFESVVRADGQGRWMRLPTGEWEMKHFTIHSVRLLKDEPLRDSVRRLRALPGKWKEIEDPLGELDKIRHGTDG